MQEVIVRQGDHIDLIIPPPNGALFAKFVRQLVFLPFFVV